MSKIAVISANLGNFDHPIVHEPQSIPCDFFIFTDENFPPRFNAMTPRLQAKIPRCFGWQLAPGYDYYLWTDASSRLKHPDSLKFFLDNCQNHDIAVLQHPRRPNIRQETRYMRKGLRQSSYIQSRYTNEFLAEQYAVVESDKDYVDDTLIVTTMFMYRNNPQVQAALKEWWYHITRYTVSDQLAFPYVLKKAELKINMIQYNEADCWFWGGGKRHIYRK